MSARRALAAAGSVALIVGLAACAPKAPPPAPPGPGIERPTDRPLPTGTYFMLAALS